MNKSLYIFLNVFLGLTVACGLLQGIVRFQLGLFWRIWTLSNGNATYQERSVPIAFTYFLLNPS